MRLLIATFNLRNNTDRYEERKPLLGAGFGALAPDIAGLQEVVFEGDRQDDFLASHVPGRVYAAFEARSPRFPGFGNAILCSVGEVQAHETLALRRSRIAHRVLVALPEGRMLWFVNTHLHHKPEEPQVRLEQARAICAWMAGAPRADATIVSGDFNTPPAEPAYGEMVAHGYRSAFREANGTEPAVTWPSGIVAPTMDREGDPACLDYLWLAGGIRARSARLAFNEPCAGDATLYASDHFAVVAELEL